jgi:hypothetical protein
MNVLNTAYHFGGEREMGRQGDGEWERIITNYQLPIINYQLPITNYQLPIINYQLPITNYLRPMPNSQLLTAHC